MKRILFALSLLAAFIPACAPAAITPVASPLRALVQAAVTAASSGDTLVVGAGSDTWATPISISGKALNIIGNGIGSSVITGSGNSEIFNITATSANYVRVSGFTFIAGGANTSGGMINISGVTATPTVGFRIDHNRFLNTAASVTRNLVPNTAYGLVDNNVFDMTALSGSVQSISVWGSPDNNDGGFTPWTRALTLGSVNAVYIENNTFTYNNQAEDCIDGYGGARIVIRYNRFNNVTVGFHGTDSGDRRSLHSFEIYNNTFVNNSINRRRAATIRGGTGVVYNNTYSGSAGWDGVVLMLYRACSNATQKLDQSAWKTLTGANYKLNSSNPSAQGSRQCNVNGSVGFCSGDNETIGTFGNACSGGTYSLFFDGSGSFGYPGRDQPGYTTGQTRDPVWVWSNGAATAGIYDGGVTPALAPLSNWLIAGRDYTNTASTAKPGYTVSVAYPYPGSGGAGSGPTAVSVSINSAGTTWTIAINETVTAGAGGNGGFSGSMSGGAVTLSFSSVSGTNLVYTANRTVLNTEFGTLSYVQPGNGWEDTDLNDLPSFSGLLVVNNTASTNNSPRNLRFKSF